MGVLGRIIKAAFNELIKEESFVKGEEFEGYLREFIFPKENYELLHRTHDSSTNKEDFVGTSLQPDFKFRANDTKKVFWLEAKFRSSAFRDEVEWCKDYQLKRYQEINREAPVFIALGVGESAAAPDRLFIFPVKHAKYTKLFMSFLKKYEFPVDQPMTLHQLWRLL